MSATVRLIRAFDGPRHERLYNIWEAIAEFVAPVISVRVFSNPDGRLSHAECYNRIWMEEQEFDNRHVILTEFDFLPNLHDVDWAKLKEFSGKYAGWGCMYATRAPASRKARNDRNRTGGWFVVLDKEMVDYDLTFNGEPDPCNQLHHVVRPFRQIKGSDCYPHHFGLTYEMGTHLFWSRHYNDHPSLRISGFSLREILRGVDGEIARWLKTAPPAFKEIFVRRFGSDVWESYCDFTGVTSTSSVSSSRSGNLLKPVPKSTLQ